MPYLETVDEFAEALADMIGIYGCGPEGDHLSDCKCRICFVSEMTNRIRQSVANEQKLYPNSFPLQTQKGE